MRKLRQFNVKTLLVLSMAFLLCAVAGADTIYFSGALSDDDELDLSVFTSTVDYAFDPATMMLTITVNNDTLPPYTISELFFNVSDNVTGLTLVDNAGFSSASLSANQKADGFGTFDYLLDIVVPGNNGLAADNSVTFILQASGSGLTVSDFFSHGTSRYEDAVASIKFTQGPGGDSVYALPTTPPIVPEPATLTLLGAAFAGILVWRRSSK